MAWARWWRCALVMLALLGIPCARAVAQPYVTVSPGSTTFVGVGSTVVTIDYCYVDSEGYGDAVVRVNSVDVTDTVSLSWETPPSGCDMLQRATLTVAVPAVVEGRYLTAGNFLYNDVAYYDAPRAPRDVRVEPGTQQATLRPSGALSLSYRVVNLGEAVDTFTITGGCSGAAHTGTCGVSPGSVILSAGASSTVTVSGTGGTSPGTKSLVSLRAAASTDASLADSTWTELLLVPVPTAGITVVTATEDRDRSACVAIDAGAASAVECGALRVGHALPTTARRNRARTPALLYSSHTAEPAPSVSVDVTRAVSDPVPDYLEICLSVPSQSLTTCANSAPPAPGETRRYTRVLSGWTSAATGRYAYTLEVAAVTGGTRTTQTANGTFAVVNRRNSPYGAGWWLTGIDRLVGTPASDDTLLWVGADGSTRTFGRIASAGSVRRFVARALDRPDTVFFNTSTSDYFRRHSNERYTTHFNTSGWYVRTESTHGEVMDECASINAAGLCPSWMLGTAGTTYTLHNNGSQVDSITAPTTGPMARTLRLTRSGAKITQLTDPGGRTVGFTYAGSTNRLATRTDPRGTVTAWSWDSSGFVSQIVEDQATLAVTTTVSPAEGRGAGAGPGAALDSTDTRIDGPRSDVADVTRIWVNAYGAPVRVRDPHGGETHLTYDSTWVALVRRTQSPLRLLQEAFYNARGLPDSLRTIGARGGTDTTVTRYTWHGTWRSPVTIIDPAVTQSFAYDATHGTRTWQQVGAHDSTRVTFTYGTSGVTAGLVRTITRPLGGGAHATDSVWYDAQGNLNRTRSALGFTTLTVRDNAGRDSITWTPIDSGQTLDSVSLRTVTLYDALGRDTLQTTVGPARSGPRGPIHPTDSVRVRHVYDSLGYRTLTQRLYHTVPGAGATTLNHNWTIDRLGRVVAETRAEGGSTTFAYNAAGQDTSRMTPRGYTIRQQFDALGRVTRRVVPQVTSGGIHCSAAVTAHPMCMYSFPTIASGVCIPADTARFRYDAAGQLLNADNRWARVRRVWTPGGLLASDTLRTRTWNVAWNDACEAESPVEAGPTPFASRFAQHVYGLDFTYDAAGRRTHLYHPNAIDPCSGRCVERTWYGALGTMDSLSDHTDSTTRRLRVRHDAGGRQRVLVGLGGVTDSLTYDADDRLRARTVSGVLVDTLNRDATGRLTRATSAGLAAQTAEFWYHGLGAVIAADNVTGSVSQEDFRVDGLGNRLRTARPGSRLNSSHPDNDRLRLHSYSNGAQTYSIDSAASGTFLYERAQTLDESGNVVLRGEREVDGTLGVNVYDHTALFYGASEQLAIANRHVGISAISDDGAAGRRGGWEYYRYDALGRRVLTYAARGTGCVQDHTECYPYIERTVWDGAQLLYEIRGSTAFGGSSDLPTSDAYQAYGRVVYRHGGGIDAPLVVTRLGLNGYGTTTVMPHANWQGAYIAGTLRDGTVQASCAPATCPAIAWPGGTMTTDGQRVGSVAPTYGWWGNLIAGQVDGSGLRYQRNRYYDPSTGQFTQADPIGLAGGANLYAFAGGDPVNFGDPFGLCPEFLTGRPCSNAVAIGVGFVPVVGDAYDIVSAIVGKDLLTGENIGTGGVLATAVGTILGSGKLAREGATLARTALHRIPGNPFTGANAPEKAFAHLQKYSGLDPNVASARLHRLKQSGGLGGADNVSIGRTGDVYNARTGEHLGTLTDKSLGGR